MNYDEQFANLDSHAKAAYVSSKEYEKLPYINYDDLSADRKLWWQKVASRLIAKAKFNALRYATPEMEEVKKECREEDLDEYIYRVWLGYTVKPASEPQPDTKETKEPVVSKNYLEQALLVSGATGARGNTYGTAEENFQRIANLWNAQLGNSLTRPLTTADVSILMVLVKLSRLAKCPTHVDSWVDIAGYVNCASQIQQGE